MNWEDYFLYYPPIPLIFPPNGITTPPPVLVIILPPIETTNTPTPLSGQYVSEMSWCEMKWCELSWVYAKQKRCHRLNSEQNAGKRMDNQ